MNNVLNLLSYMVRYVAHLENEIEIINQMFQSTVNNFLQCIKTFISPLIYLFFTLVKPVVSYFTLILQHSIILIVDFVPELMSSYWKTIKT